jgi:starch synthase (maltosyl-transferring)
MVQAPDRSGRANAEGNRLVGLDGEGQRTPPSALRLRIAKPDQYQRIGKETRQPGLGTVWMPGSATANCAKVDVVDVFPHLDHGRHPIKRVEGENFHVSASVVKEGHDRLAAEIVYRKAGTKEWQRAPMHLDPQGWFHGDFKLGEPGAYEYTVAAWTDKFGSWRHELDRKFQDGQDVRSELLEGLAMIEAAIKNASGDDKAKLELTASRIRQTNPHDQHAAVSAALEGDVGRIMEGVQAREDISLRQPFYRITVDRERAQFGAWYEAFPRSHGGFRGMEAELPRIKSMGFDVLYLPPVHPIGESHRKGKNNSLEAGPGDPGSPWAIGSKFGGHDAVSPELGTVADFEHLVKVANEQGLEIAMDLAIQCSPDHPWLKEHPDWFNRRPDGTIKYAENPPKKYQDIVQLNMWCKDKDALWGEIKSIVDEWIARGVKIFRVDNPHTKPTAFWEWLIAEVKKDHPDTIFLAEAFTDEPRMQHLAKAGFSQSYTYFTWKNARWEIEEYMNHVVKDMGDFFRPNFFANTPDILPGFLHDAPKSAFSMRYALAATLAPTAGIYSGFELCENQPLKPGTEDYQDSEKYEIKQRNYDDPNSISSFVADINRIRNENPALRRLDNLRFHNPDNQNVIAYSKQTDDGSNKILVVANLDPHHAQEGHVNLDGGALGLGWDSHYKVRDLMTGEVYDWHGLRNWIRIDPNNRPPVHVFRIEH